MNSGRSFAAVMQIYAGIDEAGYGPMLGPLCIAATTFVIAGDAIDSPTTNLWKTLGRAVCRKRTDRRRRIAIDDSKKLKNPNDGKRHPLADLERGVLSMLLASGHRPCTDTELLKILGASSPTAPWYGSITNLPLAHASEEISITGNRLRCVMDDAAVLCPLIMCEAIDADSFNRQVSAMGRKSNVNFCAIARLVDTIWKRWPLDRPHIVIDRQGSRTRYLTSLMSVFPEANIRILEEEDTVSRYRLQRNHSVATLTFQVSAETGHLPVALASMVAKYVRELLMGRLNRYFQAHMPELKPTAGYVQDARRYMAEIEPVIDRLGVSRGALVRTV